MIRLSKKLFGRLFILGLIVGVLIFCGTILSNYVIEQNAGGKIFDDVTQITKSKVGVVLGASAKTRRGTKNMFFERRIQAAANLYKSGKVEYLLVSGDNSRKSYDEPSDMKLALMALGVPAENIYMDYAGFRTWDSMIRCKEVFGQTDFIIVSQNFHNERAIYIAEHFGCNVQALNAKNVASAKSGVREYLARVKVFADIVFRKKPHFLGEKVEIGKPQTDINV